MVKRFHFSVSVVFSQFCDFAVRGGVSEFLQLSETEYGSSIVGRR